jgi:hypothetical protein
LLPFSEPRGKLLGAQVNHSHALASGFIFLVLFNEGAGVPFALGLRRACTIVGAPTWISTIEGSAGKSGATTAWYRIPFLVREFVPSNVVGGNQVTVCIIRRKTDTTARASSLFGLDSSVQTQRCGAHVPYSDGNVYWDFGGSSSPNRLTWTGYTRTTNIEKWVFVAGSQGSSIWLDGALKASQSTSIGRGTTSLDFAIGMGNGLTNAADLQEYYYCAMFDAQWGADNVAAWTANPYAILQSPAYLRIP